MASTNGSIKALTNRRGPDHSPAVSPDGKHIAYLGFDDKYQGYQVTKLYIADRDGSNARILPGVSSRDRDYANPRWASDSKGVYVLYDDQGHTKIDYCSVDGVMKTMAIDVGAGGSAYSFGASYSISKNRTL